MIKRGDGFLYSLRGSMHIPFVYPRAIDDAVYDVKV